MTGFESGELVEVADSGDIWVRRTYIGEDNRFYNTVGNEGTLQEYDDGYVCSESWNKVRKYVPNNLKSLDELTVIKEAIFYGRKVFKNKQNEWMVEYPATPLSGQYPLFKILDLNNWEYK